MISPKGQENNSKDKIKKKQMELNILSMSPNKYKKNIPLKLKHDFLNIFNLEV